jgi:hypothetical protein
LRDKVCICGFGEENPRKREHPEDPGVNVRILKWMFKKWDGSLSSGLIWVRTEDRRRTLAKAVMNMQKISRIAEELLACQGGLCRL